jgi:hypothetical protein
MPAIETMLVDNCRPAMQAAHHLLMGLESLFNKEYHKTKVHVLEALKLCSSSSNNAGSPSKIASQGHFVCAQLKLLSLCITGEVYDTTDNEHCEKMLTTAYPMAQKLKSETFSLILARLQRSWLLKRNADPERLAELDSKIAEHESKCQKMSMHV